MTTDDNEGKMVALLLFFLLTAGCAQRNTVPADGVDSSNDDNASLFQYGNESLRFCFSMDSVVEVARWDTSGVLTIRDTAMARAIWESGLLPYLARRYYPTPKPPVTVDTDPPENKDVIL